MQQQSSPDRRSQVDMQIDAVATYTKRREQSESKMASKTNILIGMVLGQRSDRVHAIAPRLDFPISASTPSRDRMQCVIHDVCSPEPANKTHRNQATAYSRYVTRLFLSLLRAGDLRRSAEGLLPVLALLACSQASASWPLARAGPGVSCNVRCCLEGFSILDAAPTLTRRKCGSKRLSASGES